jgi:hypothetical protein
MAKRTFRVPGDGIPLLDLVSYGRGGPSGKGERLTTEQIDHIRRTVQRAPEVMVKVLGRNSRDLKAAAKHLDYIGRKGELELETDDGERLQGRVGQSLLEDWDLDIDDARRQGDLKATDGRKPPKLIHKLMFSMPPGTPPDKVLAAVRNFAREEFALKNRYAFVLHTDEPHPHVHLVLKAVSEEGVRLNIKKATLRHWRSEFARNLRALGVGANATERAVRGAIKSPVRDGVYRASERGSSTRMREKAEVVAADLLKGTLRSEPGKVKLLQSRKSIERAWLAVSEILARKGEGELATGVRRFVRRMDPVTTDKERIADEMRLKVPVRLPFEQSMPPR